MILRSPTIGSGPRESYAYGTDWESVKGSVNLSAPASVETVYVIVSAPVGLEVDSLPEGAETVEEHDEGDVTVYQYDTQCGRRDVLLHEQRHLH